eukprot:TRINITY_DN5624_c0_g1_i6.p1 TRINITY_DN5624_c0_g1~~TRINITY_DN5624_c0_g1_i6.p1  ORF type:complete len:419 (+),score=95.39 TRINITY_DN5624_c0_g1_i6:227-1483(+)
MQNGGPLDINRELKKLKQLVAGKNVLKSENELLRQTVAQLESQLTASPDELPRLRESNEGLEAQLNEMLSQMVSAEEKVMAAEARAETWQKRAEDTNEAKKRSVRQLEATVAELRIQNSELQEFNSTLRKEAEDFESQLESHKKQLSQVKSHSEELERIGKETIRAELEKVEQLCGKMEQEVANEISLRMSKEEELIQQSTELEELRAAQEEATQLITNLQLDLDKVKEENSQMASEISSLKTDIREREVQVSLLTDEVRIGTEENRRLKACQKESSVSPKQPFRMVNPNIPTSDPITCTPIDSGNNVEGIVGQSPQYAGIRSVQASVTPPVSVFNLESEIGLASAQSSIARTIRSDTTNDLSHLDAELEKITNRWRHEMPGAASTEGVRHTPLPQLPRFSAEQPAHHTLAYLKQRYS